MKNAKLKKILLGILKLLYYIAIAFVCFIAAVLIYYIISVQIHAKDENYKPGISIYTIVSPSMTPVIDVYDVVVNVKVNRPENIEIGDIITFKSKSSLSQGMTITHRVVGINKESNGKYEFITQGDNNSTQDDGTVTFDNIIGKEIFIIPKLGNLQFLLSSHRGWIFIILIPIAFLIIKDIFKLIDLFGLSNRVNKVITDEDDTEKKRREEERKEELKERLGVDSKKTTNVEYNKVLTRKIEEYNTKIAELDKMINEMEQGVKPKLPKEETNERYLKGGKIKIVDTEENAKKKKDHKPKVAEPKPAPKEEDIAPLLNLRPNYLKEQEEKQNKRKGIIGIEKIKK